MVNYWFSDQNTVIQNVITIAKDPLPKREKVMDSQAKQKAMHDVHSKFREFYPGDRVLLLRALHHSS